MISVIGVGEQVGGELVVIPYKTMLDIASYAADTDFGKVFVHYITVECPYSDIHSESFGGGTQGCFFCRRGSVNVYMESGRWSIWAVTFPALNASRQTNAICCSFILYGLVYTRVTGLLKQDNTCFENRFFFVELIFIIVARHAVTTRCKETDSGFEFIFQIDTGLQ